MNFDKIVITSDQDSDGMAIELLLITFFFTYMRPLVEAGKLYRAVTPLYIITTKKCFLNNLTKKEIKNNILKLMLVSPSSVYIYSLIIYGIVLSTFNVEYNLFIEYLLIIFLFIIRNTSNIE